MHQPSERRSREVLDRVVRNGGDDHPGDVVGRHPRREVRCRAGDGPVGHARGRRRTLSRQGPRGQLRPATRATVDVRVIPQFATTPPDPMDGGTFNNGVLTYSNGAPGDLVLVRVWYRQPLLTTFLAQGLSRMNDGTAMLTATTAFRNEPA